MQDMNMLVSGYLDFAERKAQHKELMTMEDWANYLDKILTVNGDKLLEGSGSVSYEEAMEKACSEYRKYQVKTLSNVEQDYLAAIKEIESKIKE